WLGQGSTCALVIVFARFFFLLPLLSFFLLLSFSLSPSLFSPLFFPLFSFSFPFFFPSFPFFLLSPSLLFFFLPLFLFPFLPLPS
ncbi:hypothetical protein ACXWRS_10805, partial [Streptococcus pyogenes]